MCCVPSLGTHSPFFTLLGVLTGLEVNLLRRFNVVPQRPFGSVSVSDRQGNSTPLFGLLNPIWYSPSCPPFSTWFLTFQYVSKESRLLISRVRPFLSWDHFLNHLFLYRCRSYCMRTIREVPSQCNSSLCLLNFTGFNFKSSTFIVINFIFNITYPNCLLIHNLFFSNHLNFDMVFFDILYFVFLFSDFLLLFVFYLKPWDLYTLVPRTFSPLSYLFTLFKHLFITGF